MEISLEKIIEIVTREVIKELIKSGVVIDQASLGLEEHGSKKRSLEMDMSGFKTPVLTENNLGVLEDHICEVIVPANTIITPGARGVIKNKELTIVYKP